MCIITDENNVIVSISFIPGCNPISSKYKVYFPVDITGVYWDVGMVYIPKE
jgi:hypothetical protein